MWKSLNQNKLFSTISVEKKFYNIFGDNMKVKIFDEESEEELQDKMNYFLEELEKEVIDIKYQVSACVFGDEQIYCFSAMVIYY